MHDKKFSPGLVLLVALVITFSLISIFQIHSSAESTYSAAQHPDLIRLEQRVNQMEIRLYSMETNLRTLEQQIRLASGGTRGLDSQELAALRSELQMLHRRIAEHECALAKLDERTLATAARATRRKSGLTDPCRVNVDAPLELPERR